MPVETDDPESIRSATQIPRLLVVDNPPLAAAIQREWQARAGTTLILESMTRPQWRETVEQNRWSDVRADALIYPAEDLGLLAEAGAILPAPPYIQNADAGLDEGDILPLIRQVEMRWGGRLCAVPFGSAPLLLVYRADILSQHEFSPPQTWHELHELAKQLAALMEEQKLPQRIESVLYQPLSDGWAARLLIARAAAYVRDATRYSDLWEVLTMEPLIDTPPFVRALRELAEDQSLARPVDLRLRPDQVLNAVTAGKCVLGIGCWPAGGSAAHDDSHGQLGVSLLPGSAEQFRRTEAIDRDGTWTIRESVHRVPVLAAGGYVGSVRRGTRRQRAAWNLLIQLTAPDWGDSVCAAGRQAAPFRSSHLQRLGQWLPGGFDDQFLGQFRQVLQQYYASDIYLSMLRIPGTSEYLHALDRGIWEVLDGTVDARHALESAAEAWQEQLATEGLDQQSTAYLRQLGIDPWPSEH